MTREERHLLSLIHFLTTIGVSSLAIGARKNKNKTKNIQKRTENWENNRSENWENVRDRAVQVPNVFYHTQVKSGRCASPESAQVYKCRRES